MNHPTVNFTTHEEPTNSTTHYIGLLSSVDMYIFIISFFFGLPTHSYVLWVIVKETGGSGIALEFINLNLSVCETVFSMSAVFNLLSVFFSGLTLTRIFFQGLAIAGRPLFQCLICVERYLAVVHPVTFLKLKPLRYRVICCAVIWVLTLSICSFSIVISPNDTAHTLFFSTHFLLFFCIQLFCLVAVLRALKQSGPGDRRREEENYMKRRAFDLILKITVSMIIIYAPYIIIGFSFIFTQLLIKELFSFSFICFVLAGFVQPVLYLHRAGKLLCLKFLFVEFQTSLWHKACN